MSKAHEQSTPPEAAVSAMYRRRRARDGTRRALATCLAGVCVLLANGASAAADSLSVAVAPNPAVVSYPEPELELTINGTAARQYLRVVAKFKPANQGSCAPTANADGGTEWWNALGPPQAADGSFSVQATPRSVAEMPLGSYTICGWAERENGSTLGPASAVLVLRAPMASMSMSPPVPDPNGYGFTVTVSYSLETGNAVIDALTYDDPRATQPCPTGDAALPGGSLAPIAGFRVGGQAPLHGSVTGKATGPFGSRLEVGLWRVCAYMKLGEASYSPSDIIGTPLASAFGTVIIPVGSGGKALGCRVPNVRRMSLSHARKALTSGHCGVGRITLRKVAGRRRGTVIAQGARPGSRLRAGTRIALVVAK